MSCHPVPKWRVYPRVCGGTDNAGWEAVGSSGLSPRVRGNRATATGGSPRGGSIPAFAGEPVNYPRKLRRIRVYPRVCGGTLREAITPLLR